MRKLFCLLAFVVLLGGCGEPDSGGDDPGRTAAAAPGPIAISSEPSPFSTSTTTPTTGGAAGRATLTETPAAAPTQIATNTATRTGSTRATPTTAQPMRDAGTSGSATVDSSDSGGGGGSGAGSTPGLLATILDIFTRTFGTSVDDANYDAAADLDGDGVVGLRDVAMAKRSLAGLDPDAGGGGTGASPPAATPYQAARPFSNSADCKFCHPRQFNEWRTSPHAYSGISPTFYSLVSAGQNSPGAGVLSGLTGTSHGGIVGNFCLPCHSPMGYIGLEGRYGNNNGGFTDVQPLPPFVCNPSAPINALGPCTAQNSVADCGGPGLCAQFEGRTCVNMPAVDPNRPFPRRQVHCTDDADCAAGVNGCPGGGEDCGPCVIAPATIYYTEEAQEGINCETCHNALPNHQRSCQIYRNSDSAATFSFNIEEMETSGGRRLRLGPYPVASTNPGVVPPTEGQGILNDTLPPVLNAFHESARVETPLTVAYQDSDRPDGAPNPANTNVQIVRPTALTCDELPYCAGGRCQGGPNAGMACPGGPTGDGVCGGCQIDGLCGPGGPRAGLACNNSIDCGTATDPTQNLIQRASLDGTLNPLARTNPLAPLASAEIDREDGNYYRSSMMCAGCHDVRPGFVNAVLRSCQLADTQVCQIDADCQGLAIGCPGDDCGPCVAENSEDPARPGAIGQGTGVDFGDPGNRGYRRVENLFSEWQISVYNHPEMTFCQGNSFRACTVDADCGADGPCDVSSPFTHPTEGPQVITCQDCHMSNFPETPLIDAVGNVAAKNELYSQDLAALEGSQSDVRTPLPVRRVSTHFMAGVDLPLLRFPGQAEQGRRRQELIDSGFKITLDLTPTTATAGQLFEAEVTVENVGVGHRFPAGFSHERQNWMQVFVQEKEKLDALGITADPFDRSAPCHLQRTIATSSEDARDPVGANALGVAGCVYRSGFQLDKAHPETGEMVPDGSLDDEDPEDFFVVAGTRMRGLPRTDRIEVRPGAEGQALTIQNICEEATAKSYRDAIAAGSGIDMGTTPGFPYQVRFCDPSLTPSQGPGHTAPGFGNPDCMEANADEGPCVPEIELSDGNERGRCANDLARPSCQEDSDCGGAGPCLFRCSGFAELECCDQNDAACAAFYAQIGKNECELESLACNGGSNDGEPCVFQSDCPGGGSCEDTDICIGGSRSGLACNSDSDCPVSRNCGNVGPCNVESRGIVNFQNQFRQTANGACVDPATADGTADPVPIPGAPACFLNANCILNAVATPSGQNPVCMIQGVCNDGSGTRCTNVTYQDDCGPGVSCDIEFNLELNGRPSESVFIQNHPFNFNSMPPFQPRTFFYEFEIPAELAGKELVVSARLFNRHFPMRFLRNLIGTQVVQPPLIVESQGDASDPSDCNAFRTIDIDCFEAPVVTLGNAEVGGFVPANQTVRTTDVMVNPAP